MSRADKVAEALKKEISSIIQFELKDPRLGFITVTRLILTTDLRYAKVYYSILGSEPQKKNTIDALESARGYMRKLVGERVKLRFVPEIIFKLDKSVEYSIHIQEELEKIKKEDESRKGNRGHKDK